jgi:branched-chain amino acid transport system ATP-binding protein
MTATEARTDLLGASDLTLTDLYVSYGDQAAVRGVNISVPSGSCVAILGANGAGKSTILNSIAGLNRAVSGEITLASERIDRWSAHKISRNGICYIPEGRGVFPDLTVLENLHLSIGADQSKVDRAFEYFPDLAKRSRQQAGNMSGGQQQMLAVAPALINDYRLLMVDELSLGLAPMIVNRLYDLLARTRDRGASMLLVEQFAERALALADRAYVLRKGEVVFDGPASLLLDDQDHLHSLYLGDES